MWKESALRAQSEEEQKIGGELSFTVCVSLIFILFYFLVGVGAGGELSFTV